MFSYERVERPVYPRGVTSSKYPIDDILKTATSGDAIALEMPPVEWGTFYRVVGWHVRRRGYRMRSTTRDGKHLVWAEAKTA
jgi:hypothetical protein